MLSSLVSTISILLIGASATFVAPSQVYESGELQGVPEIKFCNTSVTPLVVNSYSITPDDIHSNENLTLSIYAVLKETVTSGKIEVEAKLGPIPVYHQKLDLCTEVKQGGYDCPLQATNYNIQQSLPIPDIPVHGNVQATVKITDQSDTQLLCMEVSCHI